MALSVAAIACGTVVQPDLPIHTLEETNQAALSGTLVTNGECIFVANSEGTYGVGWPRGTSWDPATQELTVRGLTARTGDAVTVGGSAVDLTADFRDPGLWEKPPLSQCIGDRGLWVVGNITVQEAAPQAPPN